MAKTAENGGGGPAIPWRMLGWGAAAALLLLPLVAMQFTDEVDWDPFDFMVMGGLLGSVGLGFELAVRKTGDAAYRIAAGVALVAAFLLVWINGAVGIIGSEAHDANLLYGAVLAVALVGATVARARPAGLARAMAAAALVQAAVPVAAWTLWPGSRALVWSPQVLVLTGVFAGLWLVAAALFGTAARARGGAG